DCGRDHALLEVGRRELEPVTQELDDEVVSRAIVGGEHRSQGIYAFGVNDRRIWAAMAVIVVAIWLVGAAVTRYSLERMAYYTPIAVGLVGGTLGLVPLPVQGAH